MQVRPQPEVAGRVTVQGLPGGAQWLRRAAHSLLRARPAFYALALLLFLAEATFLLLFRSVNQDEGWYLWAARLVYEGKLLYRDFAYTQSPLLPYVYGPFQLIFGRGLYHGRLTSLIFALLGTWMGARLAGQLGKSAGFGRDGDRSGLVATGIYTLLALSTFYAAAYAFAYTAPYALASCLLLLAFAVAFSSLRPTRRNVLAAVCLALAAGVRLSAAPALLPLACYLVWRSPRRVRAALEVLGATAVTLAAVFGPFLFSSPQGFAGAGQVMLYDMFGFHTDRMPRNFQVLSMRYSIRTTLTDFAIPLALGAAAGLAFAVSVWRSRSLRGQMVRFAPAITLGAACLGIFAAQLVPRTTGSFYNALQLPLLNVINALALTWPVVRRSPGSAARGDEGSAPPAGRGVAPVATGLVILIVLLNARLQWGTLLQRDLMVWPPQNQVAAVQRAGQFLARYLPAGAPLVSFNPQVALEAGLNVPPGFEMAVFGYQPTWSTERARAYRVINDELLLEAIRKGQGAVAFTEFDLTNTLGGQRDAVQAAVQTGYRWALTVPGAGPVRDELRVYLPPQFGPPDPEVALAAGLADGIRFLGYDLAKGPYRRGESIRFALYWQGPDSATQQRYTVFTHLLGAGETVAAGWDNPPCHGTCPTDTWRPGEIIRDEYVLTIDPARSAGTYVLEVGMYDGQTGRRLAVMDGSSQPVGDRIVLGELAIE